MPRETYDHKHIEAEAQKRWKELDLYKTDLTDDSKEKYYLLFEFPYPSGDLHIGHWYAFALTDIYARKLRMAGKNVLFPMGFDAFGLPAENAAIKRGLDPKQWTYDNMANMRRQMETIGTSVDWSKEVITCDPTYYQWTQWLFTKFYEHGLAEHRLAPVKWCPNDQTVLANEQVNDGKCERCGHEVEERNLTQWFLTITKYADRLLSDLDALPWAEPIKDAQRAWIGASEGAKLSFATHTGNAETDVAVEVFTTRPDTVFGATYLVLAPEHPAIDLLIQDALNAEEVRAYQRETGKRTERERSENKEKTGVAIEGVTAVNPATKEDIPVYIADYVLASYGTGAVMAVPAHDERDFEFAQKYNLPIRHVIASVHMDERNPHVEGKEVARRKGIIGIVHDPKSDRYLALNWPEQGWTTFVTGGIEEGEDPVVAARREIEEETGYTQLAYTRTLGGPTEAHFFAAHKDLNRVGQTTTVLFTLEGDERNAVAEEELKRHTAHWLTKDELTRERFSHAEMDTIVERLFGGEKAYTGDGTLVDSGEFSGRGNREAMWDIVESIGGERTKNYRIRDWSVGRQRYWGCPIPMVYDPEGNPHAIPSEHLPWELPTDVDFTPGAAGDGLSPLASSKELRERVTRIFGEGWTPEYDTLDTFVDSSWYFMRYLDPEDRHDFSDQALMKKWMPVDRYSGGAEHTTMHLLYSRFFTKVLYDLALSPVSEPFFERFNRGTILGPDGNKMSKSKGNVINPDEVVGQFGADAVRMYLAFIGPYNEPGSYPWNLDGTFAMRRFLDRVYALFERVSSEAPSEQVKRALALATDKVSSDTDRFKFNTAISSLMVLVRELESAPNASREALSTLLRLLAPFAPHLAEHLWAELGEEGSIHSAAWPAADAGYLTGGDAVIAVQVNGKKRGEIQLPVDAPEAEALAAARSIPAVDEALINAPKRVVYVPGRILNIVI